MSRFKEILKEQRGDQALHLIIGVAATFLVCAIWKSGWGAVVPMAGWIVWEHRQFPNNHSKDYDDASLDRIFQEVGVAIGLAVYLS